MELREADRLLEPACLETTEQYERWQPRDHVRRERVGERDRDRFVGGTNHVHEHMGGALQELRIHLRERCEHLDTSRFDASGVSAGTA